MRQREGVVTPPQASQQWRQIVQPAGHDMHHLAFALDLAINAQFAGREDQRMGRRVLKAGESH